LESSEIRERFLLYFERGGLGPRARREPFKHQRHPSAPLVLSDDPSLLFTNAGMAPFKKYFLGASAPPFPRLTSCQKCLRTSDIERVGSTPRHLTFFEMLGNFSFGDYFKEGAIDLAWGLLTDPTEGYGLLPARLWVTVFRDDEETARLWEKVAGIPSSRIILRGEDDNFWRMGDTGPCGPCTEILYDFRGSDLADPPDEDRNEAVEIWNLVLMQFNRQPDGSLERLPRQNVDTGAGLERLAWVLQGKPSVFDTDLLYPVYRPFYEYLARKPASAAAADDAILVRRARIAADHLRAASFALAANWDTPLLETFFRDPDLASRALTSGIRPGNTGRNYVVRQLIRRAMLSLTVPEDAKRASTGGSLPPARLAAAFPVLKRSFGSTYSEILVEFAGAAREEPASRAPVCNVGDIIAEEASAFAEVIAVVLRRVQQIAVGISDRVFPGRVAFELHDTHGFPIELTRELAAEYGLAVDEPAFRREMEAQRERARAARARESGGWSELGEPAAPVFTGYDVLSDSARITFLRWKNGEVQIGLDRTPFYAEAGGQIGDSGFIRLSDGIAEVVVRVDDTRREISAVLHIGNIVSPAGAISAPDLLPVGARVVAEVDAYRRAAIRRAHTATHLLHRALRDVLGEGATQAGSLVAPDYLRFDFHSAEALSEDGLEDLERRITRWVLEDHSVRSYHRSFKDAMAEGVTALFGEKYGDTVRIVEIVGVSKELCGGTHLEHTLEVGAFKVTGEESIGAGIRRVEAVTGHKALDWMQATDRSLSRIARDLNTGADRLLARWERWKEELGEAQKEADRWRSRYLALLIHEWSASPGPVVTAVLEGVPAQSLTEAAGAFARKHPDRAIALGSSVSDRAFVVLVYGDRFEAPKSADILVKEVAPVIGGGGGGRTRFAQAGGTNTSAVSDALSRIRAALSS
jgi:alanyl-tRNA synthetase